MTLSKNLATVVAGLALTLLATLSPAGAAAAAGDRDCDDFADSFAAANSFYRGQGGPYRDPHQLDYDSDGYACEDLAKLTKATGEPSGNRRAVYREFFWLTSYNFPGGYDALAMANMEQALRGALIDVFGTTARRDSNAYEGLTVLYGNTERNKHACMVSVRRITLEWLDNQANARDLLDKWDKALGTGRNALKHLSRLDPTLVGRMSMKLINAYLKYASDAGVAAANVQIGSDEVNAIYNAATHHSC